MAINDAYGPITKRVNTKSLENMTVEALEEYLLKKSVNYEFSDSPPTAVLFYPEGHELVPGMAGMHEQKISEDYQLILQNRLAKSSKTIEVNFYYVNYC